LHKPLTVLHSIYRLACGPCPALNPGCPCLPQQSSASHVIRQPSPMLTGSQWHTQAGIPVRVPAPTVTYNHCEPLSSHLITYIYHFKSKPVRNIPLMPRNRHHKPNTASLCPGIVLPNLVSGIFAASAWTKAGCRHSADRTQTITATCQLKKEASLLMKPRLCECIIVDTGMAVKD
jgi:hypothetical protein